MIYQMPQVVGLTAVPDRGGDGEMRTRQIGDDEAAPTANGGRWLAGECFPGHAPTVPAAALRAHAWQMHARFRISMGTASSAAAAIFVVMHQHSLAPAS
jgi:hypothetical protein